MVNRKCVCTLECELTIFILMWGLAGVRERAVICSTILDSHIFSVLHRT